jgi:hypothetical protein
LLLALRARLIRLGVQRLRDFRGAAALGELLHGDGPPVRAFGDLERVSSADELRRLDALAVDVDAPAGTAVAQARVLKKRAAQSHLSMRTPSMMGRVTRRSSAARVGSRSLLERAFLGVRSFSLGSRCSVGFGLGLRNTRQSVGSIHADHFIAQ